MRCQIIRNELLELLQKGIFHPLTLIVAPPGSGKSTILNHWQRQQTQYVVIRIDLTPAYDDGLSIFKKILDKLRHAAPLWDASLFNLFKSEWTPSSQEITAALNDAFVMVNKNLVIILDDFHRIKSESTQQIFSELFRNLPEHVRFVLSSRMYPAFPIVRLRLEEKVLMIDRHDLRLQKEEVSALNAELGGKPLTEIQLSNLISQTEGWFVGVKLALIAYIRGGETALNSFSGSQPELLNYFGFEVLKNLTPELRKFVLSTALFERIDADLCEKVLGHEEGSIILEKLVSKELFLMPVTEEAGCYRYHALLQDFLQSRLLIEIGKDYIEDVHRKASDYFFSGGKLSQAIAHASLCGDDHYYHDFLNKAAHEWLRRGEFEAVVNALADLPDRVFATSCSLAIPMIYALIFSRRFNQAQYYLDLIKTSVKASEFGKSGSSEMPVLVEFLEQSLNLFQQDIYDHDEEIFHRAVHDNSNPDIQAFSLVASAYVLMCRGQLDKAFKVGNQAKVVLAKTGHAFLESYADLIVALIDRYMGRGTDAIQHLTTVFEQIKEGAKTPMWVNMATGMMVIQYEQNQLAEARKLCEKLLPLVNHSCATEVVANVYLNFSRLLHIDGETQKSSRLLDQLGRILLFGKYERFHGQVVQESIRQAIAEGNLQVVNSLAGQYDLQSLEGQDAWQHDKYYQESKERFALAASYWLIAQGRYDRAHTLLSQILELLERMNIKSRALVAKCNLVVVEAHRNSLDIAVIHLKKLLDCYGLSFFSRSVFDESPGLLEVFRYGIESDRIEISELFKNLYGNLFISSSGEEANTVKPELLLTDKELQIFELLANGLSNTEISQQTDIAISTAKWHLKNIYSKLGVNSRAAAMRIAHHRY